MSAGWGVTSSLRLPEISNLKVGKADTVFFDIALKSFWYG